MELPVVELLYIQNKMRELYYEKDHQRGLYATFAWLVEEVGELARALLSQNIEEIEEEIADVIAWTLSIANLIGVDVEKSLCQKYGC